MSQYFNVSTNAGDAAIAYAIANNTKLNITHVAFGDGNGAVPTPDKLRTTLVHEVHRQAVNKYTQHPTVANWITVEAIIPSATGGFWIREIGIIAGGVMITHGSHAPFFKVADTEGVSEYRLKFTIDVHDASVVQLTLDESLIFATQEWINTNYIPRTDLVDNLTTNDAGKPLSAKQGKELQDNKFDASEVGLAGGAASLDVDGYVPDDELKKASKTEAGIVQLATNNETKDGLDNLKAITPESLKAYQNLTGRVVSGTGYTITYFDWSRICVIEMTLWENGVVENKTIQDANASDRYQTFALPINLKKCLSSDIKLTESSSTIYWNESGEWLVNAMLDRYRSSSDLTTIFARFRRLNGSSSGIDTVNVYARIIGVF